MNMVVKSLAQQTWLEARHGFLPALLLALLSLGLSLRWFVEAISLVESADAALAVTCAYRATDRCDAARIYQLQSGLQGVR